MDCHAQNPSVGSPKLSSDESGLVSPAATLHSEVAEKGCFGGFEEAEGVHTQQHHSSFIFRKPCGLPLFFISHSSLSPAPCGVLLSPPPYLSKFLCSCSLAPFCHLLLLHSPLGAECNFCNGSVGTPVRWKGLWRQVGWLCVYLLPGTIKRAVWMHVATHWLCLWTKCLNGGGRILLPSYFLYPDKGKPLSGSDGAKHVRIALPALLSSLPVCLPSFHSLTLSSFCHLASVFRGLHKSWTAFPSGEQRILIQKEIRNENSHSFSGLCSVKAWKCTRGEKTKCTVESLKEIGHVLKMKERKSDISPVSSLPIMILDYCFHFSWVWQSDSVFSVQRETFWNKVQQLCLLCTRTE